MSEKAQQIFDNIVKNDNVKSIASFGDSIREKLNDALEVRKVGLTSEIYNNVEKGETQE
jgi:NADH/NAD ratio-sensing transcriptional regulator Rex